MDDDSSLANDSEPQSTDRNATPAAPQAPGAGRFSALTGGLLALVSTALLPLHLEGGSGIAVGIGFALAGFALAASSLAVGALDTSSYRDRTLRSWSILGAVGFLLAGMGLLADLFGWQVLFTELLAIFAVGVWWGRLAQHLMGWGGASDGVRIFNRLAGSVTLACAAAALLAFVVQFSWTDAPAGAVPARFVYLLWGPWGLVLARSIAHRARERSSLES